MGYEKVPLEGRGAYNVSIALVYLMAETCELLGVKVGRH